MKGATGESVVFKFVRFWIFGCDGAATEGNVEEAGSCGAAHFVVRKKEI